MIAPIGWGSSLSGSCANVNPNAGHLEIWIKDLAGYTVVIASPDGENASDPA
jgi:hypothetical protein